PTRFVLSGSTKVRTVIPRGPKKSCRFGERSQWSTSSTSWKIITVVMPFSSRRSFASGTHLGRKRSLGQPQRDDESRASAAQSRASDHRQTPTADSALRPSPPNQPCTRLGSEPRRQHTVPDR